MHQARTPLERAFAAHARTSTTQPSNTSYETTVNSRGYVVLQNGRAIQ